MATKWAEYHYEYRVANKLQDIKYCKTNWKENGIGKFTKIRAEAQWLKL